MTTGVGTDVSVGFAIESVVNTRQAPDTFVEVIQESMMASQEFIMSKGLGGGRRIDRRKAKGNLTVGGSISMEMRTAGMVDLLRLCIGGDPAPSGTSPSISRAFLGGGNLPTATWQVVRPFSATLRQPFDYIGCMVNTWSLTQNPNEFAQFQIENYGLNAVTNLTAATFAPPASPGILTFANLTATTPDGEVCFDSISLSGTNALTRQFKVCADDPGLAQPRPDGIRSVSGTLTGDFSDMAAYNRYIAGTEGTLSLSYVTGTSTLTFAMNIFYTGETPQVSGPGAVKQGIPFSVVSETSDAAAITVTLINDEA